MEMLPAKLCLLRQVLGLSQYQIAFFLNVSQATYCRWEVGETLPCWRNLQAIASFYQLSVPEFLSAATDELAVQVFCNKSIKSPKSGGGA